MVDTEGWMEENWRGECVDCSWSHSDIGFAGVNAEARIHVKNEAGHSVEVYRDDDLMEVIEQVIETGPYKEYWSEESPTLRERKQESERIAREVADPDSESDVDVVDE